MSHVGLTPIAKWRKHARSSDDEAEREADACIERHFRLLSSKYDKRRLMRMAHLFTLALYVYQNWRNPLLFLLFLRSFSYIS